MHRAVDLLLALTCAVTIPAGLVAAGSQASSPPQAGRQEAAPRQAPAGAPAADPRDAEAGPAANGPAAKEPEPWVTPEGFTRFLAELYAIDLPDDWRELYPNEWVQIRDRLPADFPPVRPGHTRVFGAIDRWLESGYDGTALVAGIASDFEAPTDAARLEQVRRHWAETVFPGGGRRELLDGRPTTVGPDAHACLELEIRGLGVDGRRDRALEFHASTASRELILSFRAWDDSWDREYPRLRAMADSLTFPRRPKDPEDLTDRLGEALWIGAVVGLMLVGLRFLARRGGPGARPAPR